MTRQELMQRLNTDKATMDDFLSLPYIMSNGDVGRVLTELYYALYVACGYDERKTNQMLFEALLDIWDDELTD